MAYLVDANVLLRLVNAADPRYEVTFSALRHLRRQGEALVILPQTLFEFWNVCTRPATARGGFGLSAADTDWRMKRVERRYPILSDSPAVFAEWRRLIVAHEVLGVQIHDARLVAAMRVHAISHILTFNGDDFTRYPGITPINPQDVR